MNDKKRFILFLISFIFINFAKNFGLIAGIV